MVNFCFSPLAPVDYFVRFLWVSRTQVWVKFGRFWERFNHDTGNESAGEGEEVFWEGGEWVRWGRVGKIGV
jgi:hypothetical protein